MQTYPKYLTMTEGPCFYCTRTAVSHHTIADLMGIACCGSHQTEAARDIRAYYQASGQVLISDAVNHPAMKPLFDAIPKTFSIVRSSGAIESGWHLPTGYDAIHSCLVRMDDGLWAIPARKEEGNNLYLRPILLDALPHYGIAGMTPAIVAAANAVLRAGFYKV